MVAQRFLDLAIGNFDFKWFYDPSEINYLNGWGLSEDELRVNLISVWEKNGSLDGLLIDNIQLRMKYYDFLNNVK